MYKKSWKGFKTVGGKSSFIHFCSLKVLSIMFYSNKVSSHQGELQMVETFCKVKSSDPDSNSLIQKPNKKRMLVHKVWRKKQMQQQCRNHHERTSRNIPLWHILALRQNISALETQIPTVKLFSFLQGYDWRQISTQHDLELQEEEEASVPKGSLNKKQPMMWSLSL